MEEMVEPDRTIMIVSIIGLVIIWGSVAYHRFVQDGGQQEEAEAPEAASDVAAEAADAASAPSAEAASTPAPARPGGSARRKSKKKR